MKGGRKRRRIKSIFRSKPKFIGLSQEVPPLSERFCMRCELNRRFEYNPSIGHSECVVCGSRVARKKKAEKQKKK